MTPRFRIYPSLGVARLGNGPANKHEVVFSPEVPWANLFDTNLELHDDDGAIRKQAQRFYIYECDRTGQPVRKIDPSEYTIEWRVQVANKKPFWYDFNNSLDLSVATRNGNLTPNFFEKKLAPAIGASYRNPNVLGQAQSPPGELTPRRELVNSPPEVLVPENGELVEISGMFPYPQDLGDGNGPKSRVAQVMNTSPKSVPLGSVQSDNGTLIFYAADGQSASLNRSDLNTDFADNSNWYDDICDGQITATITHKKTKETTELNTPDSAAWVTTAPPDYAPQIQPLSTMYDLVCGAANADYETDFSIIFPIFLRLYRMQWVNLGDFLEPSFRETIDRLTRDGKFEQLYSPDDSARAVRNAVFMMFRDPEYNYDNEPIIPSKDMTGLPNPGLGTEELKLPFYPGDGINYPGSPAQWFAIPPFLYKQLKHWRDGNFKGLEGNFRDIDALAHHYQKQFATAADNPAKAPLLMTRAVLETLYGGGFHPGVELTWPMRHAQIYHENTQDFAEVTPGNSLLGLREVRMNAATPKERDEYFYKDFGLQITAQDVAESLLPGNNAKSWLWKITPGDLTKWMGIPWQSDAGSCQAVFTDSQYPVPAWWAANLPVDVLTEESLAKIQDKSVLDSTKRYIYANRLPWLQTTDTGFVGYHAEGGYMNGLISMVYQWKDIGLVAGRHSRATTEGIPEIVYVSTDSKNRRDRRSIFLGKSVAPRPIERGEPRVFYRNSRDTVWIPEKAKVVLCRSSDGTGATSVDDFVQISAEGTVVFEHDYSQGCKQKITPLPPKDVTSNFAKFAGRYVDLVIEYSDKCGGAISASSFYLYFEH